MHREWNTRTLEDLQECGLMAEQNLAASGTPALSFTLQTAEMLW